MVNDELGKRMKRYEFANRRYLTNRMPVIVRIDGRSFHTFTKGFERPFDDLLIDTMQKTMKYLCENVMNCALGYHQSDEITLVLADYKTIDTQPWFDNCQNKIESICASMETMAFNKIFADNLHDLMYDCCYDKKNNNYGDNVANGREQEYDRCCNVYMKVINSAMFDCRAFNIPVDEVTNNIYWRQLDATRNSIQMVGQSYFSHSELHEKTCNNIQDMLFTQKGINWNDYPVYKKRGSCCIKAVNKHEGLEPTYENETEICEPICITQRSNWIIDKNIPIFKGEYREYIEKLIRF